MCEFCDSHSQNARPVKVEEQVARTYAPREDKVEHRLKCWPVFFRMVSDGTKWFEVRKFDRDFQALDKIILQEWDEGAQEYTGDEWEGHITCVVSNLGGKAVEGIKDGYCVLGIEPDGDNYPIGDSEKLIEAAKRVAFYANEIAGVCNDSCSAAVLALKAALE